MKLNLIIRADASPQIGTGHLMRCLALAQAWKAQDGEATFITVCEGVALLRRLQDEGFHIAQLERSYPDPSDWETTSRLLAAHSEAWIVLDGYHFDSAYQHQIKEAGQRLLVIDDTAHLKHYYADIVLNQNLHAEQLHYSCESCTRLLLGTRYALLRREFLEWREWERENPDVARKVLVTLGGGDPENHTLKVIRALQKVDVPSLEAIVVVGASNRHGDVLEAAISQSSIPIRLIRNVRNMPELMAWADVAVSAAGSTCWELMFMALPSLFLIVADNQLFAAKALNHSLSHFGTIVMARSFDQMHFVYYLKRLLMSKKLREHISILTKTVIDGFGVSRAIAAIMAYSPVSLSNG